MDLRTSAAARWAFLSVTALYSWGMLGIAKLAGTFDANNTFVLWLPYAVGPLFGALFLQWRRQEPAYRLWGGDPFPNKWFLVAWGLGPLVAVLANFVAPLVGSGRVSLDLMELVRANVKPEEFAEASKNFEGVSIGLFLASNLMDSVLKGVTFGTAVALGEEIGWRVALLRQLASLSFWPAALITGLARGLWAVPMALAGYPYFAHPHAGALLVVAYSLLAGVLATYLRVRGGSVLPAAILMGGLSSGANLSDRLVLGGSDISNRSTGLAGIVLLALLVLLIVVPKRREAAAAWDELRGARS